ncbi:MAG: efflux RND transporter permease subunit [Clostridiales Family XIII bacterium]|jgi:HAE1 family hydrophobic/amphiphilic exporter-1|nr:efflux RND transporter permease subunit [Clostridiales Family XIII bacterium]
MIKFSVRKPFTVFVLIAVVFVLGYGGLKNMTPELLPELEFPYVLMITTYPGATPEKVEQEVTKPLEKAVASLENLKSISSQSNDNVSVIQLEFEQDVNLDSMTVDMLQTVDQVKGGFDEMVGSPYILKMSMDMMPVMIAAVDREGMDTGALSNFVKDELETKLEGIEGVASVDVSGLVAEQVNVVLRQDKIDALNERVRQAVLDEFIEKEQELRDTQNELEEKKDEADEGDVKLRDGLQQLADKAGEGAATIAENQSDLTQGMIAIKMQITIAEQTLAGLDVAEKQAVDQLLQNAADEAVENAKIAAGGTLPPGVEEQIRAGVETQRPLVEQQVREQFDPQRQEALTSLESARQNLILLEDGQEMLSDATAKLQSGVITGNFELASGSAALIAAQAQIAAALAQIDSGLEQIQDAKDDAVEKADVSGLVTMDMLAAVLTAQNFSMPAGYVQEKTDGKEEDVLIRVGETVPDMAALEQLTLFDLGFDSMMPVKLKEVADIYMTDNLDRLYAKIDGQDGVVLILGKQSVYATAQVCDNIKERFDELSGQYDGLKFTPLMDQGEYIYMVTGTVAENLAWGALFAILILFLFLRDIRPTFVVLCSIPISLAFAIVLMYFAGVTINIISLSGLAVAVGMLVDNSIVVIENIFRLRAKGFSAVRAAVTGASQVAGAITASTLTTICVFVPIVFVQGMTRKLFTDMALTLAFSLLASLLIALTLVPAMASGLFARMEPKPDPVMGRMLGLYEKMLSFSLRCKPVVLILAVVLLGGSFFIVYQRGFEYMPESDTTEVTVTVTPPEGSDFETLKARTDEVTQRILEIDGVKTVGAIAGDNTMNSLIGLGALDSDDSGATYANFYIITSDDVSGRKVGKEIEERTQDIDAEVKASTMQMMDASAISGSGITIDLTGDDMDDLVEAAYRTEAAVENLSGVDEVNNGLADATPELRYAVNAEKASEYELTVAQVFEQVSRALTIERSSITVDWNRRSYDVILKNGEEDELTPQYIKDYTFTVTKKNGDVEDVKLADLVTVTESESPKAITRVDQKRQLTVTISIADDGNVTLVQDRVEAALAQTTLPAGVGYAITGEGSTILDAIKDLSWMLVIGILLVYLVMVAQFQSLKSPFIVMFAIPLAFTGGFLALLITGKVLSVISLVGFVMLVGVIVNNAIVLVDYINQMRMEGMARTDAIIEAGKARMRPILMTALTTVLGLAVMALGIGNGSEMMQPLAIVCIGGLLYATLMTMLVVPVIYDIFNKKELRVVDEADLVVDFDA